LNLLPTLQALNPEGLIPPRLQQSMPPKRLFSKNQIRTMLRPIQSWSHRLALYNRQQRILPSRMPPQKPLLFVVLKFSF
jgi:hypothetical protein